MADKSKLVDPFDLPPVEFSDHRDTFDWVGRNDNLETEQMVPDNLTLVRESKIETFSALKRKFAIEHLNRIPDPGTSVHIVTNARFDFWDWTPAILKMAEPRYAVEWFGSTWILNRRNAVELLAMYDNRKIRKIGMITGVYFKRRESATFATLCEGLMKRGQKFKAALNHSKWFSMLLSDGTGLTVEGSANFTENGNIENFVYTNDRALFEFHKQWASALLDAN
jgi:hypothetical protein